MYETGEKFYGAKVYRTSGLTQYCDFELYYTLKTEGHKIIHKFETKDENWLHNFIKENEEKGIEIDHLLEGLD